MLRAHLSLTAVVALLAASGCKSQATAPLADANDPNLLTLSSKQFPIISGGASTKPLSVATLGKLTDSRIGWIWTDVGRRLTPMDPGTWNHAATPTAEMLLARGGWHDSAQDAYQQLLAGQAQLLLVARPPAAEEIDQARAAGIELRTQPVALDGLVFLVNRSNPVANLSMDQIRGIYLAQMENWRQVGGYDQALVAYEDYRHRAAHELMNMLVMDHHPPRKTRYIMGQSGLARYNALAGDPNGIGYCMRYEFLNLWSMSGYKALSVDGIEPNDRNIQDRRYPLTAEILAVTRQDSPPESPPWMVADWLLTRPGQEMIREYGYIPLPESRPSRE